MTDKTERYALVPRLPTYQMAEAMGVKWESGEGFPTRYAAMLAAAPTAEALAAPAEGDGAVSFDRSRETSRRQTAVEQLLLLGWTWSNGQWSRPTAATAQVPFRNMKDGATFEDYRDQLAVGNLTPVDQMAFDNLLHDVLAAAIARAEAAEADSRRLDWLDSQRGDDVQRDRNGAPELVAHYWGVQGQCYDVREAIDREQAAIAAQQAEGEGRG